MELSPRMRAVFDITRKYPMSAITRHSMTGVRSVDPDESVVDDRLVRTPDIDDEILGASIIGSDDAVSYSGVVSSTLSISSGGSTLPLSHLLLES